MPRLDRDIDILERIRSYCIQVEIAHNDFKKSKDRFIESTTYQNAISMCILQIGELVSRLSNEFKETYDQIPWRGIRGMRNYVAHEYGAIDFDVVWSASTTGIDEIRTFCEEYLRL